MTNSVIVTGASGGIGSQICADFAESGFTVIGVDRAPSEWTGGQSYELSDPGLKNVLTERFDLDGLSCIVHAAAEQILGHLEHQTWDNWRRAMWTNFLVLDDLVRSFQVFLSTNAGSVVLVGSVHAFASRSETAVYGVSKAAAEGWVKSASIDYAPGIRINSVMPGAIQSGKLDEFTQSLGGDKQLFLDRLSGRTPMKRLGTPGDVSHAVRFLASQESSFITGQTLIVDGGATRLLATEIE